MVQIGSKKSYCLAPMEFWKSKTTLDGNLWEISNTRLGKNKCKITVLWIASKCNSSASVCKAFPLLCFELFNVFEVWLGGASILTERQRYAVKGGRQARKWKAACGKLLFHCLDLRQQLNNLRKNETNSAALKKPRNFVSHEYLRRKKLERKQNIFTFMIGIVMRGKGCSFEIFQRASC